MARVCGRLRVVVVDGSISTFHRGPLAGECRMNRPGLAALGTILILSATIAGSAVTEGTKSSGLARHLDAFPSQLDEWTSARPPEALDPRVEQTLGASEYTQRVFARNNSAVDLFIAYYANQRAG